MAGDQEYSGLIELTWTNKDQALLADDHGSYRWVPKRDWRVAEVRLLNDAGTLGEVHQSAERAKDNLLIRGDALNALTSLLELPEFAAEYAGKVKLVYIDPPFNTGQAFEHYDDGLEHSVWLTMMRDRLSQIYDLLHPEGSVWVHLDDAEMAYCKVMMDGLFGRDDFVASVVWENFYGRSNAAGISNSHNTLLVYAPSGDDWRFSRNLQPRDDQSLSKYSNPDDDPRGPWRNGPIFAPDERHEGLMYSVRTPSGREITPPRGSHWRMTKPEFDRMVAEGRITFGADGTNVPAIKLFLSEVQDGLVPRSWWPHTEVGHSQEGKREIQALFPDEAPFATPKPERLLQRIVHIATNPGDIVLDCFAGSGTTAAVAHKMGRRWVTSELSRDTLDTFTAPRLEKVVTGQDPGGITESVGWEGGGGFRILDVAPSMFVEDEGLVVLADAAENGTLSEMVAAQLGFEYEPDPPFVGRAGKMRLAVIDGHLDESAVRLLVRALAPGERLSVAATSLDTGAADLLVKLKSGSRARVIPQDILLAYRSPSAWRASVARTASPLLAPENTGPQASLFAQDGAAA